MTRIAYGVECGRISLPAGRSIRGELTISSMFLVYVSSFSKEIIVSLNRMLIGIFGIDGILLFMQIKAFSIKVYLSIKKYLYNFSGTYFWNIFLLCQHKLMRTRQPIRPPTYISFYFIRSLNISLVHRAQNYGNLKQVLMCSTTCVHFRSLEILRDLNDKECNKVNSPG